MKPAPFDYHAPATTEEALGLLGELGDDAKVLAGGQSLIPMLALRLTRFDHLIDLGHIESLRGIETDDATIRIGAMTRQVDVERDARVERAAPLLARATRLIGHFQIRNQGTIGGSLAHADPAAEYPAVALALDAQFVVAGRGGVRRVAAADFFVSTWMTTVETDEILTSVEFPTWDSGCGFAVEEVARRHGDFAIAGAACGVGVTDGRVARAAISLFGMAPIPLRASTAEQQLVGSDPAAADLVGLGREAVNGLDPPDDVHASGGYRRHSGAALVTRALGRAIEEAQRA